jgi:hypothetical protein
MRLDSFRCLVRNVALPMFEWINRGFEDVIRIALLIASLLQPTALPAQSVKVRYREGVGHGFLVLRTSDGKPVADGDSTQIAQGDNVTSRMSFKFTDGSVYEQTTTFSQRGTFQLLKDHVIQKGPQFKPPMETSIDATTGEVTVRYTDDHGKERVLTDRLDLPPDVANGLVFTLLKDVEPNVPQTTVSYVAATPKPRLVHLEIIPQDQEPFSIGSHSHKALRYTVKVKIGGVAGLIAPLMGKQPAPMQAWVLAEGAPAFIRFDGPLCSGGPVWRMELAVPASWPGSAVKTPQ